MKTVIIQPPLVQLNTPYPSGAYLSAFFRKLAREEKSTGDSSITGVSWFDLSEQVFHRLFSRNGLETLFSQTSEKALERAADAERKGDDETAWNLRRYVSQSDMWIRWIDPIVNILCGKDRELTHEFVRSAHVPRGRRMENFMASLERPAGVDDALMLASFALADLADYITYVFDGNFALIRYAEAVSTGDSTFDEIEETVDAPFLKTYYRPLLEELLTSLASQNGLEENFLFLVTVPFGGTFSAALLTCRMIKEFFDARATVSMGGGYINTALREVHDSRIFQYTDYISYDKGYGFYSGLLGGTLTEKTGVEPEERAAYIGRGLCFKNGQWTLLLPSQKDMELEERMTRTLVPDFSDIDFTRYPRVSDDTNPMHRIWSDGAWLKAFLAYGCYWHRCAFCDTTLDYVCSYKPADANNLYEGLYEQALKAGTCGIHFVDEAAPPVLLERFALDNCRNPERRKLSFWGNIRFEKTFTRDAADILAWGGLTGVSGGIEIASGEGLSDVNKGIDIDSLVGACAAFKEAGVLVHSYMIYGFYNETPQMLMDSAETLRQLFAAGLIDSAFWHKFTLTRYSTVYNDWKNGRCNGIKPIPVKKDAFAVYEQRFEGEDKSEKYGAPLMTALDAWMHGEGLGRPMQKWFPFPMPKPSIPADFIDRAIERYEHRRNKAFKEKIPADRNLSPYVWIGGKPLLIQKGKRFFIEWTYMDETITATVPENQTDSRKAARDELEAAIDALCHPAVNSKLPDWLFKAARGNGLAKKIANIS